LSINGCSDCKNLTAKNGQSKGRQKSVDTQRFQVIYFVEFVQNGQANGRLRAGKGQQSKNIYFVYKEGKKERI
jgi:hypothetical protein